MSVRSRVRRAHREAPELNITAFMNLMVVLVPFLLITAVFSHLSILELNLPPDTNSQQQNQNKPKVRNFELVIRKDSLTVSDTLGGVIKQFSNVNGQPDFKGVSELLVSLKSRFPDKKNITILLEPSIKYDQLVQAMDTVRVVKVVESASVVHKELFPQIAIGDAP